MSGGHAKVPVFATIANAYAFALGEFPTVLRLTLLPTLAVAVAAYFFVSDFVAGLPFSEAKLDPAKLDFTRFIHLARMQAIYSLIAMTGAAIAIVALMRALLFDERQPGLLFYLRFGAAEIRVVFASVVIQVLLFLSVIPLFFLLAAFLPALKAGGASDRVSVGAFGIGGLCVYLVVVWLMLRLSLYPAVAVSQNSLGLAESWVLTRGNALRLFVVTVLTLLPLILLTMFSLAALVAGHSPSEFKDAATLSGVMASVPTAVAIMVLLQVLFGNAFFVGIVGSAYLSLTGATGEAEAET